MNKSNPYSVKVKIERENGKHCVKEVWGDAWRTTVVCDTRERALFELEKQLDDKSAQWSREIKMRAGWVCQVCGELDKSLLESHHIKPRAIFPKEMYELSNGQCLCIYHHAFAHSGIVRERILARYALILHRRFNSGCQEDKEETGTEAIHQRT